LKGWDLVDGGPPSRDLQICSERIATYQRIDTGPHSIIAEKQGRRVSVGDK
jgi:hypothetical protein